MEPKEYITLLKRAGKALKLIRDEELKDNSTCAAAIEALQGPFLHALATQKLSKTSGMVELQKYFAKLKP